VRCYKVDGRRDAPSCCAVGMRVFVFVGCRGFSVCAYHLNAFFRLCRFRDAEEYALIGSVEHCESHEKTLMAGAVAYLNVDVVSTLSCLHKHTKHVC
jgi:hypothetical protein